MSDSIISVESLGKRYRISHQQERQRYVALRDVIAAKLMVPLQWLGSEVSGQKSTELPTLTADIRPPASEDFWALKDVSFEIKRGEVVGIIGRNGAGKSTVLKILSRITEPSEGRVTLRGRVASLLEVGTGFHPELTGRENIFLNGAILGMMRAEIKRRFDEIVAFAEVERFLDTPVKRYSSGMYVRLAFAVAAHMEPEILVVDEVLAVGDAEFQKKCLGRMGDIASEGRTVLFVSHNLAMVAALCSRAVLLRSGKVEQDGEVVDVITRYQAMNSTRLAKTNPFDRSLRKHSLPAFTSATLIDESGNNTTQIPLGGEFLLEIEVQPESRLRSPLVGIGIDDVLGRRLLTIHSPVQGMFLDGIAGQGSIRCRIQNLPLAPGEYTVKLAISEKNEEIDVIEQALIFDVLDYDGLRDGEGYTRGLCVARSEWAYSPTLNPDPRR